MAVTLALGKQSLPMVVNVFTEATSQRNALQDIAGDDVSYLASTLGANAVPLFQVKSMHTTTEDVEAGLAIAELVAGMTKPVVSLVLGGGHSIGVPIAVAAKKSFIAESATMTIHPVRMNGLMLGVPQAFEYFQRMQRRITKFVTDNSSVNPEKYNEMAMNTDELVMDIGTILDGKEAVQCGLIDKVGTLHEALCALYKMIDKQRTGKKKSR